MFHDLGQVDGGLWIWVFCMTSIWLKGNKNKWNLSRTNNDKPDIDDFRLLIFIKTHGWNVRIRFWSALGQGQTVSWQVTMLPVHIASHALWCWHGQGFGMRKSRKRKTWSVRLPWVKLSQEIPTYLPTDPPRLSKSWTKYLNVLISYQSIYFHLLVLC